jgi:hypothetical protein
VEEEFRREGQKTIGQKESEKQEKPWRRNSDKKKDRRQLAIGQKESEKQEKSWRRNSDEKKDRRQLVKRKVRSRRKCGGGIQTRRRTEDNWSKGKRGTGKNVEKVLRWEGGGI